MDILTLMNRSLRFWGGKIKKNAPKILTTIAIGGVAATAYEAAKAGPVAKKHLDEATDKKREETGDETAELTLVEKVKVAAPDYTRTAIAGGVTAGCMIASTCVSGQQVATAMMSATMAENALKEHYTAVQNKYGKESIDAIQNDINTQKMKENAPHNSAEIIDTGEGHDLFYYVRYGIWFYSDIDRIRTIQIDLNDDIDQFSGVSENELLHMLKLNDVVVGDMWGFPKYNADGQREPRVEFKLTYYRDQNGEINNDYQLSYILNGNAAIALDFYPWCGPCLNWEAP